MVPMVRVLIFLEMLFMSISITHHCVKKKYHGATNAIVLFFYTLMVLLSASIMRRSLGLPYLGNFAAVILGSLFIIPFIFLYEASRGKIMAMMLFSWIYSLSVTFGSYHLVEILHGQAEIWLIFFLQTFLFLFTVPMVIRFIRSKYVYVLKNIPGEMDWILFVLSFMEFITLVSILFFSPEGSSALWRIITMALVSGTAAVSFNLLYLIVRNYMNMGRLEHLAYTDSLTGLRNRLGFFADTELLLQKGTPFTIIYMDLDRFKEVNDLFGHAKGDEYLADFSKFARDAVGTDGRVYRMSGDEFTCIYHGQDAMAIQRRFEHDIMDESIAGVPFNGISIGMSRFPEDGQSIDELVDRADEKMYRNKDVHKNTHRETYKTSDMSDEVI